VRAIFALLFLTATVRAQDDFEIQVYDYEITEKNHGSFELHLNAFADGTSHFTLEPHMGLLTWLEAGAYFETQLNPDGSFHYGGVKLRLKGRVPRRLHGFGLALNVEWSSEPSGMGGELRPIVDFEWKRLYLSVNPIVTFSGEGVDFEPAVKIAIRVVKPLALGAEYYGTVTAGIQRLFGVLDAVYGKIGLNLGAGYSWGDNQWIVKAIVAYEL
jgi:hypothetical protein